MLRNCLVIGAWSLVIRMTGCPAPNPTAKISSARPRRVVERVELQVPGYVEPIVVGFRQDGSASFFFGPDPVYQFNAANELRRAFVNDLLYKAEAGRLVSLRRERSATETALVRHELTPDEAATLLAGLTGHFETLRRAAKPHTSRRPRSPSRRQLAPAYPRLAPAAPRLDPSCQGSPRPHQPEALQHYAFASSPVRVRWALTSSLAWTQRFTRWYRRTQLGSGAKPPPKLVQLPNLRSMLVRSR